jgi:hypothetical protein
MTHVNRVIKSELPDFPNVQAPYGQVELPFSHNDFLDKFKCNLPKISFSSGLHSMDATRTELITPAPRNNGDAKASKIKFHKKNHHRQYKIKNKRAEAEQTTHALPCLRAPRPSPLPTPSMHARVIHHHTYFVLNLVLYGCIKSFSSLPGCLERCTPG